MEREDLLRLFISLDFVTISQVVILDYTIIILGGIMQYYSHYIWESGSEEKDNPISVVLQQVSRKNHHYLLACVCDGRAAERDGAEDSIQQTICFLVRVESNLR